MSIDAALSRFTATARFKSKGPLCVALVTTQHARSFGLPLDPARLLTGREGQVLGLGVSAVQAVLERHGITKILAREGGRTSRGSLANMRSYVAFLNEQKRIGDVDLDAVETFWVARVQDFFAAKPLTLKNDPALSVRGMVAALMGQVEKRQSDADGGATYAGTVMQHMVGAKLQTALKGLAIVNHSGSNVNDAKARGGDFDIGDVSIHVTTAPGQPVIDRFRANVDGGRKPMVVTTRKRMDVVTGLAEDAGIGDRIDILEFEQFIAANVHELGGFTAAGRATIFSEIVSNYNTIIDEYETDPSLRIELR